MFRITAEEKRFILRRRAIKSDRKPSTIPPDLKRKPGVQNFMEDAKNLIKDLKSEKVLKSGNLGIWDQMKNQFFVSLNFKSPDEAESFFFDESGPEIPRTWKKEETDNPSIVRVIVTVR